MNCGRQWQDYFPPHITFLLTAYVMHIHCKKLREPLQVLPASILTPCSLSLFASITASKHRSEHESLFDALLSLLGGRQSFFMCLLSNVCSSLLFQFIYPHTLMCISGRLRAPRFHYSLWTFCSFSWNDCFFFLVIMDLPLHPLLFS